MASKSNRITPPTTKPSAPRTVPSVAQVSAKSSHPAKRSAANEDQVRSRAYFLWEQAGRPTGDGAQFWLEAENELANAH